jgi:hypothetical protein
MPNDTTTRGYPLPHPDNVAREDAQRIRDALQAISEDLEGMGISPATETEPGGVRLATAAEATAGTANDAVPVVKRVKDMITAAVTVVSNALTALTGRVTQAESDIDALADGLLATGNTVAGHTTAIAGKLDKSDNLASLTDKPAARTSLGLGAAALKAVATLAQMRSATNTGLLSNDQVWEEAKWVNLGNLSGTVTIDLATGCRFYGTMIGNVVLAFTNGSNGQPVEIVLSQDPTGGRTVSYSGTWYWPTNRVPDVNTAANGIAVVIAATANWAANALFAAGWKVTA